jgi:hypothetical protein
MSAKSFGTNAVMRETGKSRACVWRWQEPYASEGFEGLLRDKTPSRSQHVSHFVDERRA